MKKCLSCGYENRDDAVFCENCGSKSLVIPKTDITNQSKKICQNCGNELGADNVFCDRCGSKYVDKDLLSKEKYSKSYKINKILAVTCSVLFMLTIVFSVVTIKNQKYISYFARNNKYSDFTLNDTILYQPINKRVNIIRKSHDELIFETSSKSVEAKWVGKDTINVTYKGKGIEYIKVYNVKENRTVYILVVGSELGF